MAAVCDLETASAQELFEGKMNFKGKLRELPVMVMSSKNILLALIGKLYDAGLRFCNLFLPLKIDYSPATPFFLRCPPPTPPLHSHISFNIRERLKCRGVWKYFWTDTYMKVYICISRVNLFQICKLCRKRGFKTVFIRGGSGGSVCSNCRGPILLLLPYRPFLLRQHLMALSAFAPTSSFLSGKTSSGKTYTMIEITEYALPDIYGYIRKHQERDFVFKFSAMEIYNELVRDLLSVDNTPLRLLDDTERETIVEKLTEEILRDWGHVIHLLCICEAQRKVGETSLNEMSSRSHQIIRLTIESCSRDFLGRDNASTLTAAVAGSERAS